MYSSKIKVPQVFTFTKFISTTESAHTVLPQSFSVYYESLGGCGSCGGVSACVVGPCVCLLGSWLVP